MFVRNVFVDAKEFRQRIRLAGLVSNGMPCVMVIWNSSLPQLPYIILIMSTIYIFHPSINHSLIITTVRPICPTMKLHLFTLLMKVNI